MVAKAYIKSSKDAVRKVVIQPQFDIQMVKILEFGIERFGVKVAHDFYTKVMNRIVALPATPHIYPKNRFIESTEKKIFRNILVGKYAVLYSVTARTIRVITIYHTAINPKTIMGFAK
jgi:plasmid stabilization system protein ParE